MKIAYMGILFDRNGWNGPHCVCTKCLCEYTPTVGTSDIFTVKNSPEGLLVLTQCPLCHTYTRTVTGIRRPGDTRE